MLRKIHIGCRRFLERIIKVEQYICSYLLMAMTLITVVQVFVRYVLNRPFSWSEEVTLMMLVWFGYLCMSIDIYHDGHAALHFLYNKVPPLWKKALDIMRHGLLGWFFFLLVKYGIQLCKLNRLKIQPATGWSYMIRYIPLAAGGVLMLLFSLSNLLGAVLKPVFEYKEDAP